jgi:hypothetical protein
MLLGYLGRRRRHTRARLLRAGAGSRDGSLPGAPVPAGTVLCTVLYCKVIKLLLAAIAREGSDGGKLKYTVSSSSMDDGTYCICIILKWCAVIMVCARFFSSSNIRNHKKRPPQYGRSYHSFFSAAFSRPSAPAKPFALCVRPTLLASAGPWHCSLFRISACISAFDMPSGHSGA